MNFVSLKSVIISVVTVIHKIFYAVCENTSI